MGRSRARDVHIRRWCDLDAGSHAARGSRYEHRARHRAALLELATRRPVDARPPALVLQWGRVFGAKWRLQRIGDVRELGMDARSSESERRVMRMVSVVAVRRVGGGDRGEFPALRLRFSRRRTAP